MQRPGPSNRPAFTYRGGTSESAKRRATQQGGMFDSYTVPTIPTFTPKEGDNTVRFLPALADYEGNDHFGIDIWVHSNVGPDRQQYLCLFKMKGEPCPCCDDSKELERQGMEEQAKELRPSRRVLFYVIDRADQETGPKLWSVGWTNDRDIANRTVDKSTGEALPVDHWEQGYDLGVTRNGKGLNTRYTYDFGRRATPLHRDTNQVNQWLQFVQDNPLPSTLVFFTAEHIARQLAGGAPPADAQHEDVPTTRRGARPPVEAPVEEAPVEEAPAEEVPVEQAPEGQVWDEETGQWIDDPNIPLDEPVAEEPPPPPAPPARPATRPAPTTRPAAPAARPAAAAPAPRPAAPPARPATPAPAARPAPTARPATTVRPIAPQPTPPNRNPAPARPPQPPAAATLRGKIQQGMQGNH